MKNFVIENPKATVTAITGLILFAVKKYLIPDLPNEVSLWIDMILSTVIFGLLGRYTRISKSQAKVLEMPKVKAEVMTEEIKTQT